MDTGTEKKLAIYAQHNSGCNWLTSPSPKPMLSPLDLSHSTKELNTNYVSCTTPSASDRAMLRCIYVTQILHTILNTMLSKQIS